MDVYINDKRLKVNPAASIGKGGEADIFDVGGGVALKLWKGSNHPDIAGSAEDAEAAEKRISILQSKMLAFPCGLPGRVVAPIDLVTDKAQSRILGYTMRLVAGAETLMSLGEPTRRRALGGEAAKALLCDLWKTVSAVHAAGVVLGDFNDLNVLVREGEASLVDADSFQFGGFPCIVFTERFLDPLLCDPSVTRPALARPFDAGSDWYAFAVMAMNTLLCVGPYGGVFRPKDPARRVPEPTRPLRRITVFDPEVRYPKPAIPYGVLPDDLLHFFAAIFERDARAPLPLAMLEALRFTSCLSCGAEHARARCPACDHGAPREVVVIRGQVKVTRRFATSGTLLAVSLVGDAPAYVVHEDKTYKREDGTVLMRGPLDGQFRFWIQGKTTYVAKGGRVLAIQDGKIAEKIAVDVHGNEPAFAVNDRYRFFVYGGKLFRRAVRRENGLYDADEPWGDVLAGQTRLWIGERMGFGFYRAGALSVAFTFDAERRGIKDTVRIPWPSGQIIGADACIDEDRVWFFLAFSRTGRIYHFAAVIGADGALLGSAESEAGDGSWLGSLFGRKAIGGVLLAGTSGGLARVELAEGALVETRRFAETEPFLHPASRIVAGRGGLWIADLRELTALALG